MIVSFVLLIVVLLAFTEVGTEAETLVTVTGKARLLAVDGIGRGPL